MPSDRLRAAITQTGRAAFAGLLSLLPVECVTAEEPVAKSGAVVPGEQPMPEKQSNINYRMKTLGGRQFWGDVLHFRGWRIQHNVITQHYRLLDPSDVRHAWGTEEQCQASLDDICKERRLKPMSGKAAILLHGIGRSSKMFDDLAPKLREEGYTVIPFDYPSTQVPLADSGAYLNRVIASLEGIESIDLICHSMGGLVVRASLPAIGDDTTKHDPRIRRMVLLGVPSLGAHMANRLRNNIIYKLVTGPAGQQLVAGDDEAIAKLPIPDFEFAIIAGAKGDDSGWNPLIPGDDDGTVALESTRLQGARDFMTVKALHSFISANPETIDCTLRFLNQGTLRMSGEREPIEAGR